MRFQILLYVITTQPVNRNHNWHDIVNVKYCNVEINIWARFLDPSMYAQAATEFVRNMRYYSHMSDEYCIMLLSHDSGDTHYPAAQDPSV